ncbi:unnamed protein product [Peronospora farinosa]|uniref:Clathrin/coatomer adaptor adaptin-like N-terminal domain-containing protein n=1 Tax=Peronospora farinosa TaxID=134698 RepID=A0ABN8CI82_9STRA|nr:unnamed protein product [Peronospora farinosa]
MEMLESIICIVSQRNIEQVLLELNEYATEVDVEFVHRSVRAIGRCAVKLERAAEKCINVLLELIQTKVNYIYESIIATLCENLDTLDEPEAKASTIWIIGEYAKRIDNADELLESFMDSCDDETAQVHLQLLTATVKLFSKRLNETQEMVQKVLHKATENSDSLELRDRGDDTCALEPSVLDELIGKISTLASVYHKLPSAFVVRSTVPETEDGRIGQKAGDPVDLLDMGTFTLGDPSSIAPDPVAATSASASLVDIFGGPAAPPAPVAVSGAAVQKKLLMDALPGKGLVMTGAFTRHSSNFVLDVDLENQSSAPITGVSIQFNKSTFGVVPMQAPITFPQPLAPGQTVNQVVPMSVSPQFVDAAVAPNLNLQAGSMASTEFISMWQSIAEANEHYFTLTMTNIVALFELTFDDTGTTKVCLKLEQKAFSTQMQQMMERLLA